MLDNLKRYIKKRSRKAYLILGKGFSAYRNAIMRTARLTKGTDRGLAVFSSFDCRNYNDNPRYISEALHMLAPNVKIVWLFKDGSDALKRIKVPDYITIYNSTERKGVSALARARVVVDNFTKRFYLDFPGKDQVYIQTWHGDRAFKKVGYDNPNAFNVGREESASLCIAGSDYGERQFRTAFHYKGEVMKIGTPRDDILVNNDPELAAAVKTQLGLDNDTMYLLYAPTFRDTSYKLSEKQKLALSLPHVLDRLTAVTGKPWKCLVRAHYFSSGIENTDGDSRLITVTGYQEMGELMLVSDALLTDYSSCAGDYALLRRPIFLYQDDIEDYTSNQRGLYFDMKDSPYWAASTPEALDQLIERCTPDKAKANCDAILKFYGTHECGHAAETVARYIIEKLNKGPASKRS